MDLQDKTYFAKVYLERDDEMFAIDARPSDCIALALRTKSPIFVLESLLRDGDSEEDISYERSMEDLQRQIEKMDPDEFGKLWS